MPSHRMWQQKLFSALTLHFQSIFIQLLINPPLLCQLTSPCKHFVTLIFPLAPFPALTYHHGKTHFSSTCLYCLTLSPTISLHFFLYPYFNFLLPIACFGASVRLWCAPRLFALLLFIIFYWSIHQVARMRLTQ